MYARSIASSEDPEALVVLDAGRTIAFTCADVLKYHGPGSPGGVAHAFKVLQRALPLLETGGAPERREIGVRTAFPGPGARDCFECVLRAVTEDRYEVDPALERPDLGSARTRFVFRLAYRGRAVTLTLRAGFVTDEFVGMLALHERTAEEEERLTVLKQEMADRVMSAPDDDVYDAIAEG